MRYNVAELLNTLEFQTEHQLAYVIRYIQNLSESELLRHPDDGGWSVAEVVIHLNTYGEYYLPKVKSAITLTPVTGSKEFKSGILGDYFIRMIRPQTGTKKLKAVKQHQPVAIENPHEAVSTLIQQLELFLIYCKQLNGKDLACIRIPTSISSFIKLRLGDVLLFFAGHVDRHMMQAGRLTGNEFQPLELIADMRNVR